MGWLVAGRDIEEGGALLLGNSWRTRQPCQLAPLQNWTTASAFQPCAGTSSLHPAHPPFRPEALSCSILLMSA